MNLIIKYNDREITLTEACSFRKQCQCIIDGIKYCGISGDDALWIDLNSKYGIKLVPVSSQDAANDLITNLNYLKNQSSIIFPDIGYIKFDDKLNCVVFQVEKISACSISTDDLDLCTRKLFFTRLCPEDEWMKPINMFGNKIVDFHRFTYMSERYSFPVKNTSQSEMYDLYNKALMRYKARGDNKWKGKIYQGMYFDNGAIFEGYSSDNIMFDSYRKLSFCYLNKANGHHVLDIGCNEGFFSFQSALHGANTVDAIDLCLEDILLAQEIQKRLGLNNIYFSCDNITTYLDNVKKEYNLTFLLSVLHQIYPNMIGCEGFLDKLASITNYLVYETPIDHPKMNITQGEIFNKLNNFFKVVRLLYIYNAYSSGSRAIYICYR